MFKIIQHFEDNYKKATFWPTHDVGTPLQSDECFCPPKTTWVVVALLSTPCGYVGRKVAALLGTCGW